MKRHLTVEAFVEAAPRWKDELVRLREILVSTGLQETLKWGSPVYAHQGKNIVGIAAFKNHFGLWFFQGALLSDAEGVLVNAQEGVTKAMRQWRMTASKEIKSRVIKAYVKEAVLLSQSGKKIRPARNQSIDVPAELNRALASNKRANAKFAELTKGKQREFTEYIASAKRPETKQQRIEKILPMILEGVGLNDKYR